MTYRGRVEQGVVVIEGNERPKEGTMVRIIEEPREGASGNALEKLAGKATGLPVDLAERHDEYRRQRR